jgi:RNA polymerase sigma-70 factor (ECF subfamily)
VRHAAAGDLAAFERLYHRHCARIHTLARRMLGAAEADEATQDTFVRAWEKLGTFRGEAAFATWLHRLAIHLFLARRAREARLRDRFLEDDDALATTTARATTHPELRLDLERAIEELPEGARQVFTLYDVEGYRHEEVAELLGITVGTSKSQLHRARMLLRVHLT